MIKHKKFLYFDNNGAIVLLFVVYDKKKKNAIFMF